MSPTAAGALAPLLTPQGHLRLAADADAPPLPAALHDRLAAAFAIDTGHGLLQLGASEVGRESRASAFLYHYRADMYFGVKQSMIIEP